MSRFGESDALHERVQRFIAGSADSFDDLACDIARFQAHHVPAVGNLWRSRNITSLASADEIPAVVCDAFRFRRIAAHAVEDDVRCFATSGTTGHAPGLHPMRRLDTYRAAALTWAHAMLLPDVGPPEARLAVVALTSSEAEAPQSSLTFMLARFGEALGGDVSWHYDRALDVPGIVRRCDRAALVAGTSFAFVALLDSLGDRRLPLMTASRVMVTGGFKGRSREVEPVALRQALADAFALPLGLVIGEYGMTELSSQLYQREDGAYAPPPWLRVTAVDPETLAPSGPRGLARIVDLANVDSAVCIQTADVVTVQGDGSVLLHGRAHGATARGCSLALEHLLDPREGS